MYIQAVAAINVLRRGLEFDPVDPILLANYARVLEESGGKCLHVLQSVCCIVRVAICVMQCVRCRVWCRLGGLVIK